MKRNPMWNVYDARWDQAKNIDYVGAIYSDLFVFSIVCFISGNEFDNKLLKKIGRKKLWLWLCGRSDGFFLGLVKYKVESQNDQLRFVLPGKKQRKVICHGILEIRPEIDPNAKKPLRPSPKKLEVRLLKSGYLGNEVAIKAQITDIEVTRNGAKHWQPLDLSVLDLTLDV